jgi:hypothetical protein
MRFLGIERRCRGVDIRALGLTLLVLAGCTAQSRTDPPVTVRIPRAEVIIGGGGIEAGLPAEEIGIPPGHRPPPGSCRVWYPGVPPGQQPPPGPCNARVPDGAVLVRGY